MNSYTTEWVHCPICGEPDMEMKTDNEGYSLIFCVNHSCPSNVKSEKLYSPVSKKSAPKGLVEKLREAAIAEQLERMRVDSDFLAEVRQTIALRGLAQIGDPDVYGEALRRYDSENSWKI